eukprot:5935614-Amphidinium_carterae.1
MRLSAREDDLNGDLRQPYQGPGQAIGAQPNSNNMGYGTTALTRYTPLAIEHDGGLDHIYHNTLQLNINNKNKKNKNYIHDIERNTTTYLYFVRKHSS